MLCKYYTLKMSSQQAHFFSSCWVEPGKTQCPNYHIWFKNLER